MSSKFAHVGNAIMRGICLLRGHRLEKISLSGEYRFCSRCGARQELSLPMRQAIRDYEFLVGQGWTVRQIEETVARHRLLDKIDHLGEPRKP